MPAALPSDRLAPHEVATLQLLASGHTEKEIGDRFDVGVPAISMRLRRAADRLGFRTTYQLLAYAAYKGWVTGELEEAPEEAPEPVCYGYPAPQRG